jgi:hypothetical protein
MWSSLTLENDIHDESLNLQILILNIFSNLAFTEFFYNLFVLIGPIFDSMNEFVNPAQLFGRIHPTLHVIAI